MRCIDRPLHNLTLRTREAGVLLALGLGSACLTDPATYGGGTTSSTGGTAASSTSGLPNSSSTQGSSGDGSSSSAGGGGAGGGLPTTMPSLIYAKGFGDSKYQELKGLVVDPDGNVYIAGIWTGTATVGSMPWLHGCVGLGTQHAFLAKLSPSGTPLWAECLNATGPASALAIAYDDNNETVVVGGSYAGTLSDYPPGSVTSQGGTDGFVIRLTHTGTRKSLMTLGGPSDDAVTGVFATSTDVFLTGTFQGTASFGGIQRTATGGADLFLARTNAGAFTYAKAFSESATSPTARLSGDATALQLAGSFDGSLDFGGSTSELPSSGGHDGFVATFDLAGNATYSAALGGAGDDAVHAIAVGTNAIAVGGEFASTVDFDGAGGQAALVASDAPDAFLALVKPSHSVVHQRRFGAAKEQRTLCVSSRGGAVLAGGSFRGTVDFGGVPFTSSDEDGFAVKANSVGELDWIFQLGSDTGIQRVVAADRTGDVVGGFNAFGGTMYSDFSVYSTLLGTMGTSNPDIFVVAFED